MSVFPLSGIGLGCPSLFISQYYESELGKHLELYNYGVHNLTLSDYDLQIGVWADSNRQGWSSSPEPTSASLLVPLDAVDLIISPKTTLLISSIDASEPASLLSEDATDLLRVQVDSLLFDGDDSVLLMNTPSNSDEILYCDVLSVTASVAQETSFTRSITVDRLPLTNEPDFPSTMWTQVPLTTVNSALSADSNSLFSHIGPYSNANAPVGQEFQYVFFNVTISAFNIEIFGQSKMDKPEVVEVTIQTTSKTLIA